MTSAEWKRKAVHAGIGLFALTLRWLDWRLAALAAILAVVFNAAVMPRIGRGLYRDAAVRHDAGIVAYPAMVALLILVFAVRLRVPTGAEQLDRMDLGGDETAHVIQRAVNRAYPFLEREGLRNNFLYSARGKALDVQVVIPERLGWTPGQLRSPQFQQRFMAGFHQALAQVGPTRIDPTRSLGVPALARGAALHEVGEHRDRGGDAQALGGGVRASGKQQRENRAQPQRVAQPTTANRTKQILHSARP